MVKQLLFAHSIPGHPRPLGRPHLTWMDTAMHDDVWRGVVSRC